MNAYDKKKLKKLSNFCFCSIFIFNKKDHQRNALLEFLTSQTEQMAFPIFKAIMRQLSISVTY